MTHDGRNPMRFRPGRRILVVSVSTMLVVSVVAYAGVALRRAVAGSVAVGANGARLVRTVDGLLWSTRFDALPSPSAYNTNGSGSPGQDVIRWQRGLLGVGINNAASPHFFGYFLETKQAFPAGAFVQTQMLPYPAAANPGQVAETIVAVQTASTDRTGLLNYVIVSYRQSAGQGSLSVGFANGLIARATTTILGVVAHPDLMTQVRDEPVTITTNGNNAYETWIGNTPIYQSSHLHMRIAPPFQVYLEVQAAAVDYTAYFRTLDVYRSDRVRISHLPPGAEIRLSVSHPGAYPVRALASASGTASLVLPPLDLTVEGVLEVSSHGVVWKFPPLTLHGGDHYQWRRPL